MLSRRSLSVLLLLAVLVLPSLAAGAELKIVTIDMDRVFNEYYRTRQVSKEFKEETARMRNIFAGYEKELVAVREKRDAARQEAEAAAANPVLAEPFRQEKIKKAKDLEFEYGEKLKFVRSYASQKDDEGAKEYGKKREAIVVEILAVIKDYAAKAGIDLVLDNSGQTSNRIPLIVYAKAGNDISDDIVKLLNAGKEDLLKQMDAEAKAAALPAPAEAGKDKAPAPQTK